jgi:hypothetical protein
MDSVLEILTISLGMKMICAEMMPETLLMTND